MDLINIYNQFVDGGGYRVHRKIGTIALCKDKKNQYDKKNIMYAHIMVFRNAWHRMILEICYEIVLQTMKKKI